MLNIVIFSSALLPGSPKPIKDLTAPRPPAASYFPIHAKRRIFFLPG